MTVGDLMMELLNATTTGGVPESAPVMLIAPGAGALAEVHVRDGCVVLTTVRHAPAVTIQHVPGGGRR